MHSSDRMKWDLPSQCIHLHSHISLTRYSHQCFLRRVNRRNREDKSSNGNLHLLHKLRRYCKDSSDMEWTLHKTAPSNLWSEFNQLLIHNVTNIAELHSVTENMSKSLEIPGYFIYLFCMKNFDFETEWHGCASFYPLSHIATGCNWETQVDSGTCAKKFSVWEHAN